MQNKRHCAILVRTHVVKYQRNTEWAKRKETVPSNWCLTPKQPFNRAGCWTFAEGNFPPTALLRSKHVRVLYNFKSRAIKSKVRVIHLPITKYWPGQPAGTVIFWPSKISSSKAEMRALSQLIPALPNCSNSKSAFYPVSAKLFFFQNYICRQPAPDTSEATIMCTHWGRI